MTDVYAQDKLTEAFLTLNDVSGKPYIRFVNGEPTNIAFPNIPFVPPSNKQYFVLAHLPGEPNPAGMGTEAEERFDGLYQIDICSPLGKGEDEVNAKYEAIAKLFRRGAIFGRVLIRKTYRAQTRTEDDIYVMVIRVEWSANLPI
jgi:hypothetical protein